MQLQPLCVNIDLFHKAKLYFGFSFPKWLKNIFIINGFDERILLNKTENEDIVNTENFAKPVLPNWLF